MSKILLIGAGRSTSYLIRYLLENASSGNWSLVLVDKQIPDSYRAMPSPHSCVEMDISDKTSLLRLIRASDVVISMLPAHMHTDIARMCIAEGKHMATASYLSDEMKEMDAEARAKGVTILNEMGVDPGIDHMSAMDLMTSIREKGGKITHFESFTGGLVAPEYANNPWQYKFTWNPRNVVLAGQGGAVKFIQEGMYKYIPYHKIFRRTEIIDLGEAGKFEGYANRDSLKYRETYGLHDVKTMYRGTLRKPGFCRAWNAFVELGATDDTYILEDSETMAHREFINTFLAYNLTDTVEMKLRQYLNIAQDDVDLWERLEYLDIFSDETIGIKNATPAMVLQKILEKKWRLEPHDKDMIVMWHKVKYQLNDEAKEVQSFMICKGEDQQYTAMAKTVGLPLAISIKRLIDGKIDKKGCILPVTSDIYQPVLEELKTYGIAFTEKHVA